MKTTEDKPSTLSRHGPVRASLLGWNWTKSRPLTLFIGAALRLSPPRHAPQPSHLAANGLTCRLCSRRGREILHLQSLLGDEKMKEWWMAGGGAPHVVHTYLLFITKMCVAWILPRSWRQATDRVKVWNHVWKYSPSQADWHLDTKTLCAINSSSCYVAMLSPSCLKLGGDCDAVRCTFHPFMNVNG